MKETKQRVKRKEQKERSGRNGMKGIMRKKWCERNSTKEIVQKKWCGRNGCGRNKVKAKGVKWKKWGIKERSGKWSKNEITITKKKIK